MGSHLKQNSDWSIEMSQQEFSENVSPVQIPKQAKPMEKASDYLKTQLRGLLGASNWVATQTRPDLAAQTSLGLQKFPNVTISDLKKANQVARRSRQFADTKLKVLPLDLSKVALTLHTDASLQNTPSGGTQGGILIGITSQELVTGKPTPWSPVWWRSYKLRRTMASTLASETHVLMDGLGALEWALTLLHEVVTPDFDLKNLDQTLKQIPSYAFTDAKSVWDHLNSDNPTTGVTEKRAAVDFIICKESLKRTATAFNWTPGVFQLADMLTKEDPDALDSFRHCVQTCQYQIADEHAMLLQRAQAKEKRKRKGEERARKAEEDNASRKKEYSLSLN